MADEIDTQAEPEPRPYWRRSELWDYEDAIRKRVVEKQSYQQILDALVRLGLQKKLSARRVGQFCVEQLHIHSRRPSRHDRTRGGADKTSACTSDASGPAALPAPSASAEPPGSAEKGKSTISELLAEDEASQVAQLGKFFKPTQKD
jgi:hypothetical protein